MAVLAITVTGITDADYDGVEISVKRVASAIDGKSLPIISAESETVADADCKTNYRAKLTAAGYTWDSEA